MNYRFLLFLLVTIATLTACEDDEDPMPNTIIGTWKLSSVYLDPGDSSGDFEAINSDLLIHIDTDTSYTATGSICDRAQQAADITQVFTGSIDLPAGVLRPRGCLNQNPINDEVRIEFTGDELILDYQCIERCAYKFRRR